MSKKPKNALPAGKPGLILYGRHAVLSAVRNNERFVSKILVTRENVEEVQNACKAAGRDLGIVAVVDRKEIDRLLPPEAVHQGFAVCCRELLGYSLEEIIDLAAEKENCHLLILDQVTDPQNIGAIMRSCVAFNTLALIMQDKNSPAETGAMAKAAAGMMEYLPVCRVTNLSRAIEQLKTAGFWIIGMDGYAQTTIDKINKSGKNAIVMGSEGKGMRRLVEETCDTTVRLEISSKVESLNVATAAAIALYEMNKG